MNFFTTAAALSALVAIAQAQSSVDVQDQCLETALSIPQCGLNILTSIGSSYGCAFTDLACQCSNSAAIQSKALTPVLMACNPTTALDVQTSADALCSCVKYSASVPASAAVTASTSGINNYANQLCVNYGLAIPTCGTAVLQSLASSIAGCDGTDFQCQCAHVSAVQSLASTPVINACGTTTALLVQSAAAELCSCITANDGPPPGATANATAGMSVHAGAVATARSFLPIGTVLGALMGVVAWL